MLFFVITVCPVLCPGLRVRLCTQCVRPQRPLTSIGPDHKHSSDQNAKLSNYKIWLYGIVDVFSRHVFGNKVMTNIQAATVLRAFEWTISTSHGGLLPQVLRIDHGKENYLIEHVCTMYGTTVKASRSTENIRIERSWTEANWVTKKYKLLFERMEAASLLNRSDFLDLFSLHQVFLPDIQADLNHLVDVRNHHVIQNSRRAREVHAAHGSTFIHGRPCELYAEYSSHGIVALELHASVQSVLEAHVQPEPRPWETDPLSPAEQAIRAAQVALSTRAVDDLVQRFVVFRDTTYRLILER